MAFSDPIQALLQAAEAKNRNRQQMNQDLGSFGQSLGQAGQMAGQFAQGQRQKAQVSKTINDMLFNPLIPPEKKQALRMMAPFINQTNAAKLLPSLIGKQSSPWRVVSGMLSKSGKPVQQNESTGEVREANMDVVPTGRGNAGFGSQAVDWGSATPEDKNLAKALYEGRIRSFDLGYRDRSVGTKLANEYALKSGLPPFKSYAGDVAAGTAKSFAFGKFGQNENSLNTALGHVNSAYDAYQQIGNTNQAWLNQPLNKLRAATNDPNVVKLGITLNALRGELATVFKGSGGTDQEIATWQKYLNENLTPDQVNAAIPQVDELLRSRLQALNYQRQSGMAGRGEAPLLSPHGAEISKKFEKGKKPQAGGWSYVGPAQ